MDVVVFYGGSMPTCQETIKISTAGAVSPACTCLLRKTDCFFPNELVND